MTTLVGEQQPAIQVNQSNKYGFLKYAHIIALVILIGMIIVCFIIYDRKKKKTAVGDNPITAV